MIDFSEQKNFVQDLMTQLSFPFDAQKTFINSLDRISGSKMASAWFSSLLQQYDESERCSYEQMLAHVKAMSEAIGIHEYTVSLLLFLCMAKKLRSRYLECGIDESVWYNSLLDLRYKLNECRSVYGINGSFVSWWFPGFFNLTRFALCRLQFEVVTLAKEYIIGDKTLPAGSKAINIHIPRTGTKLDHQEVLESYRLAAEMFAHEFKSQPIVFTCTSWLLDPWILTALPPTSNLVEFHKDFKIVESTNYNDYKSIMLVLFDRSGTENTANLPKDTSLRRAYAERIERGEPAAQGKGFFIYQDGKIENMMI